MTEEEFFHFLEKNNQHPLRDYLSSLDLPAREKISQQLSKGLTEDYFIAVPPQEKNADESKIAPLSPHFILSESIPDFTCPRPLHIIILAAGQGTRLGFSKPKALLPFHQTSLIGHHFQKFLSLKQDLSMTLHLLLSKEQGGMIVNHLQDHQFFGFSPSDVNFHYQNDAFFLDEKHHLQLSSPHTLAKGPAGNGEVFQSIPSRAFDDKDLIFILPIDNPLGINALPHLLFGMQEKEADLSLCVFPKDDPKESLGVLLEYDKKPTIIDYPFLPPSLRSGAIPLLANTNLFALRGDLFHHLAKQKLPFHTVMKRGEVYQNQAMSLRSLYRFERFITDIVPFASKPLFLLLERNFIYCAIKDPLTYQNALTQPC